MLIVYYLYYNEIDFLPYKGHKSLRRTFHVIYDLYGSRLNTKYFLNFLQIRMVYNFRFIPLEIFSRFKIEPKMYRVENVFETSVEDF